MRNAPLQERRNRQILADLVRTYIETGEPVSSRAISKRFEEILSTATIRNVMADLEDGGFLYQPHTSAGRVPTAAAYRFFAQEIASQATLSIADKEWIRREFSAANNRVEITERAGHVLAEVSNGLGIVVSPPLGRTVLEHARIWLLPDGRVVVVLISPGGITRDKVLRPPRVFSQQELDATAEFLNRQYSGWTHRLITVLNACIDSPEPVLVQIGLKEISQVGDNLALISAPYTRGDGVQGSLGVIGPTRMHYERAINAVAYVAQIFSETLSKIS